MAGKKTNDPFKNRYKSKPEGVSTETFDTDYKLVSLNDDSIEKVAKYLLKIFDFVRWEINGNGLNAELIFHVQHRNEHYTQAMRYIDYHDISKSNSKELLILRYAEAFALSICKFIIREQ